MSEIRKLVAILVADVVGYSRLPAPMRGHLTLLGTGQIIRFNRKRGRDPVSDNTSMD